MASPVLLGNLQQENLVLLECQLRKSEDDALALVSAHDRRVVADPQRFDDTLLLSGAFGRLAVRDDKAAIVHLEGDVRVVGNLHMEVDIMNQYVTGTIIKELRERNKMTQLQLADKLGVTDKTISKWETGVSHS